MDGVLDRVETRLGELNIDLKYELPSDQDSDDDEFETEADGELEEDEDD